MNDDPMDSPLADRSLIEAARAELGPSAAQRRRLRKNAFAAAGLASSGVAVAAAGTAQAAASVSTGAAAAPLVAGTSAAGASLTTAGLGSALTWKVAAVIASIAAVGGVTVAVVAPALDEESSSEGGSAASSVADGLGERSVRSDAASEATDPASNLVAPPSTAELDPEVPAALEVTRTSEAPSDQEPVSEVSERGVARVSRRPAEAAPTSSALVDDEIRLIERAHAALRAHDPARALDELARHAERYPDGSFREERLALRARALCEAGDPAGQRAAEQFVTANPTSLQASRLREACGLP